MLKRVGGMENIYNRATLRGRGLHGPTKGYRRATTLTATGMGGKIAPRYRFERVNEVTFDAYGAHSVRPATVGGVEKKVSC